MSGGALRIVCVELMTGRGDVAGFRAQLEALIALSRAQDAVEEERSEEEVRALVEDLRAKVERMNNRDT